MGVSRLDSFTLASAQTITGYAPVANQLAPYPVNGLVTFITSGTATGLSAIIEVYDGANWVQVTGLGPITANGSTVWIGTALGVRAKVNAIASGAVTIVAVFVEY